MGFSRNQIIEKLVEDHKQLPGFSRNAIYHIFPEARNIASADTIVDDSDKDKKRKWREEKKPKR